MVKMKKPSYLTIYETVKEEISAGKLPEGTRLPTEPELSKRFGVSIGTLRRAVERLELERLIRREQGRGTFVQCPPKQLQTKPKEDKVFIFGNALAMKFQSELNEIFFGEEKYKQINLASPLSVNPELSEQWQSCSLIQLPMTMFRLPELNGYLAPLPEELEKEAEKVVPNNILNECRTLDGHLRLLPVVVNPTVCYCWKPGFEKAGLPLPGQRLYSWGDFVELCRKLTNTNAIPGFGIMPFPGLIYEILLWSFGGDYFDNYNLPWLPEKAFNRMIELLKTLYNEKLCYNPFGQAVTQQQFFSNPEFCMTFYGPLAIPSIAKPEEWHICPISAFGGASSVATTLGLSLPCNSPNPEKAIAIMKKVFIEQRDLLSQFTGETPGAMDSLEEWNRKQIIEGTDSFCKSLMTSRPISGRTGYERWWSDVYTLIDEAAKGIIPAEDARKMIIDVLYKKRVRGGDTTFYA
jgi:DNA-binding transcriptional regulator YhcF (GntR family)